MMRTCAATCALTARFGSLEAPCFLLTGSRSTQSCHAAALPHCGRVRCSQLTLT